MKKLFFTAIFIIACLCLSNPVAQAKVGHDNIIILVDISGSTRKPEEAKPFQFFIEIVEKLMDRYVVAGDYLKIFTFATDVKELTPGQFISSSEKAEKKSITRILKRFDEDYAYNYKRGDHRVQYTDMGKALEVVANFITGDKPGDPANRNLILILTDGKHDAEPGTKYAVTDRHLQRLMQEAGKNILNGSWDIRCFGLGNKADLELLAKVVNDPNPVKTDNPEDIIKSIGDIIQGKIEMTHGIITLKLVPDIFGSYRHEKIATLELRNNSNLEKKIMLDTTTCNFVPKDNANWQFELANINPETILFSPGNSQPLHIQLLSNAQANLFNRNEYCGNIHFEFKSGIRFYPAIVPVNVFAVGWMDYWKYYIYSFSLAFVIILFFALQRIVLGKKPKIQVSLFLNDEKISEVTHTLTRGQTFCIGDIGISIPGLNRDKVVTVKYLGNDDFALLPEKGIQIEMDGKKTAKKIKYTINRMKRFAIIDEDATGEIMIRNLELVEGTGFSRMVGSQADEI